MKGWVDGLGHPAICFLTITRAADNPATKKFRILDLTAPIGFRISEYLAATLPGIYILAIAPAPLDWGRVIFVQIEKQGRI